MTKPENLKCPECNGPMISRVNKQTEQRFWGCQDFPNCKGTRNTDGEAPRRSRRNWNHDDLDEDIYDPIRWDRS